MKKLKLVAILFFGLLIGILLYQDARSLDLDSSDFPVDEQLAITISQRYLAGFWTHPVKLHLTPYEGKNVEETAETYIVEMIDERDTPLCKVYQIVVEKDTGKVLDKEEKDYCH